MGSISRDLVVYIWFAFCKGFRWDTFSLNRSSCDFVGRIWSGSYNDFRGEDLV